MNICRNNYTPDFLVEGLTNDTEDRYMPALDAFYYKLVTTGICKYIYSFILLYYNIIIN